MAIVPKFHICDPTLCGILFVVLRGDICKFSWRSLKNIFVIPVSNCVEFHEPSNFMMIQVWGKNRDINLLWGGKIWSRDFGSGGGGKYELKFFIFQLFIVYTTLVNELYMEKCCITSQGDNRRNIAIRVEKALVS